MRLNALGTLVRSIETTGSTFGEWRGAKGKRTEQVRTRKCKNRHNEDESDEDARESRANIFAKINESSPSSRLMKVKHGRKHFVPKTRTQHRCYATERPTALGLTIRRVKKAESHWGGHREV